MKIHKKGISYISVYLAFGVYGKVPTPVCAA